MRKTFLTALAILGLGGAARANPYMTEGAMAVAVPGTMHVQVSYFCQMGSCGAPTSVTRDGQALTETWTQGGVSHNGGSGVAGYTAFQFCDCSLQPGTHKYEITAPAGSIDPKWDVSVTLSDAKMAADAAPADASYTDQAAVPVQPDATDDGEIFPWDEPEPTWPQGLDCVARCGAAPVEPTGETAPTADAAGATDAVATQPEAGGGSTCMAGMVPSDPGVALLLAGLALGLARRRRG